MLEREKNRENIQITKIKIEVGTLLVVPQK